MKRASHPITIAICAALQTMAAAILVLNFIPGEKKTEQQVTREYGLHDAQLIRTMGRLPGPSILQGNRFQALRNGDEIFPPVLEGIAASGVEIHESHEPSWHNMHG
jgi:cardiolipin synthase